MAEFLMVPLDEVRPDPNQPRKFFEESGMKELTDSVREKGVIQAIVVRPNPDGGYMVVSGERRFRASLAVMQELPERNTIPALIRDLTDQEALELQIIENLQRKEVHPMEEAIAFKSLNQKLSTFEIAEKVGKSDSYVLKRMKLTELIEPAQKIFYVNRMEYSEALKLSRYDEQTQMELLESITSGSYNWEVLEDYSKVSFLTFGYRLGQKAIQFSDSSFDQFDPKLYPAAGSCIGCQFNSRTNPELFETKNDTCYKPSCFEVKCLNHMNNMVAEAQKDPSIILVSGHVYKEEDKAFVAGLKKKNIPVLSDNDYWYQGEIEDLPMNWEQWLENEGHIFENMDEEEKAETKEEFEEYENGVWSGSEEGRNKVKSGKWMKAFCVAGHHRGKFIYIEIQKKSTSSSSGSDPDTSTPQYEIVQIQQKEKRSLELDFNKKWSKARETGLLINEDKFFIHQFPSNTEPFSEFLSDQWRNALYVALHHEAYYALPTKEREEFKPLTVSDLGKPCKISDGQFLVLIKHWIVKKLDAVDADGARLNTTALYELLKSVYPEKINPINSEIEVKSKARQKKVQDKIEALQLQIKSEKPEAKKKGKKAGKQLELATSES